MYSSDLQIIEKSENIANEVIYEKDSKLYINFFETVERFISENGLVVSGNTANALLCGLDVNYNNFYEGGYKSRNQGRTLRYGLKT